MKNNYNDLPQLIVALDNKDDTANYVHIYDVKEDVTYYCPCCKGVVKPRAYKKENEYQVQPHFYHESGGCSEESFVHYICKTWLFENGSIFMVDGHTYTVLNVETEKTLHTSFGDYRPDIIVETKDGKTLFFEIAYSSKKSAHYIPIWDELGIDVVEINAREFINQKHNNDVPEFKVIYSDGECFIKSYTKSDYDDTIGKRKSEWKRQDKLNYKIQWEKLDWFWNMLCQYKNGKVAEDDVVSAFKSMDYNDQVWCYKNIKNKTCTSFKEQFKELININFFDSLKCLQDEHTDIPGFLVNCNQVSPLIYVVEMISRIPYLDYNCYEKVSVKIRAYGGLLIKVDLSSELGILKNRVNDALQKLKIINECAGWNYIKSITPISHWAATHYPFCELHFIFTFHDHIHNSYIKEEIGKYESGLYNPITLERIEKRYNELKKSSLNELKNDQIKAALMNNSKYREVIDKLKSICYGNVELRVSSDFKRLWLVCGYKELDMYEYSTKDNFDTLDEVIYKRFEDKIRNIYRIKNIIEFLCDLVNSSKNQYWEIRNDSEFGKYLFFFNEGCWVDFIPSNMSIYEDEDYFKTILLEAMRKLASGEYGDVRLMEE